MGRYSRHLSAQLADLAGIEAGQTVLDVGAGPGALTGELVARVGASAVTAVDPSEAFVAALRARLPGVRVEQAAAAQLPFAAGKFLDASLAQLVVHFMTDPVAGLVRWRGSPVRAAPSPRVYGITRRRPRPAQPLPPGGPSPRPEPAERVRASRCSRRAPERAFRRGRHRRLGRRCGGRRRAPDLRGLLGAVRAARRPDRGVHLHVSPTQLELLREYMREELPPAPLARGAGVDGDGHSGRSLSRAADWPRADKSL